MLVDTAMLHIYGFFIQQNFETYYDLLSIVFDFLTLVSIYKEVLFVSIHWFFSFTICFKLQGNRLMLPEV